MPRGLVNRIEAQKKAKPSARPRGAPRPASTAGRGVQQPRQIPVRYFLYAAGAVVLAAGLSFGAFSLYHSPLLAVSKVEVRNAKLVDPDTVTTASGVLGQNIATLDVEAAQRHILENPLVKSAEIHRQFPKSVSIDLQEREPWGFWESGGGRYVIDRDGVVLNRGLPAEGAPLVMQLDSGRFLQVGDTVDVDALNLTRTLQARLPEAIPANRLPTVAFEFRNKDGLTVNLKSGLRVTFGDSHDLEYKLSALKSLLAKAPDSTFVDLRFGDRIVFQGNFRP